MNHLPELDQHQVRILLDELCISQFWILKGQASTPETVQSKWTIRLQHVYPKA